MLILVFEVVVLDWLVVGDVVYCFYFEVVWDEVLCGGGLVLCCVVYCVDVL